MQVLAATKVCMKPIYVLVGVCCWLAANAWGQGADYIIKQRAKELNNQNNVRQGVAPPTQAAPSAPGAGQAPSAAPDPALAHFEAGLGTLSSSSSAAQKQLLAQQLVAGAQGAKPALATASQFVDELVAAASERALPASSRARLARELDAVLNPGKYPGAKLDGIFNDIQAIFQANGVNRTQAVGLADSVRKMSNEVQQGGAK